MSRLINTLERYTRLTTLAVAAACSGRSPADGTGGQSNTNGGFTSGQSATSGTLTGSGGTPVSNAGGTPATGGASSSSAGGTGSGGTSTHAGGQSTVSSAAGNGNATGGTTGASSTVVDPAMLPWPAIWGGTADERTSGIAVSPLGTVIVAGSFSSSQIDLDPTNGTDLRKRQQSNADSTDLFIVWMNRDGTYRHGCTIGSANGAADGFIAAGPDDSVLLEGTYVGTVDLDPGVGVVNVTADLPGGRFVLKLGPSCEYLWSHTWSYDSIQFGLGQPLAVDTQGAVYLTGSSYNADLDPGPNVVTLSTTDGENLFVLKLDSDGNFVWVRNFGGPSAHEAQALALAGTDTLVVTGNFSGTADLDVGTGVDMHTAVSTTDAFVVAMLTDGDHRWAWTHSDASFESVTGTQIAGASDGSVVVAGDPYFISKLSSDGAQSWLWNHVPNTYGVAIAPDSRIMVTGHCEAGMNLDPSQPLPTISSCSGNYVSSFASDGTYRGTLLWGDGEYSQARFMAVDADNFVFVGADLYGTNAVPRDDKTVMRSSAGENDVLAFRAKLP